MNEIMNQMKSLLVLLSPLVAAVCAAESEQPVNLFLNGDMEIVEGARPAGGWFSHGENPLGIGEGRHGGRALTIGGPEMPQGRSHRGAATTTAYELEKGKAYRLSWRWKCPDKPGRSCRVMINGGSGRRKMEKVPTRDWEQVMVSFVADKDIVCGKNSHFFIGVGFAGTVHVDDIELQEIPGEKIMESPLFRYKPNPLRKHLVRPYPGPIWPEKDKGNLIPNASFELGARAWASAVPFTPGTIQCDDQPYRLMGKVDHASAKYGSSSLRIDMDGDNLPDCLNPLNGNRGMPATTLFAATFGLIPVTRGQYILSAWLKADRPGTVATLTTGVPRGGRMGSGAIRRFAIGTAWRRVSLPMSIGKDGIVFVYPLIGLNWQLTDRKKSTLWIDAVQLEPVREGVHKPTAFRAREAAQVAVDTDKLGNIFEKGEDFNISVHAFNGASSATNISGTLTVTDYWDREVFRKDMRFKLSPDEGTRRVVNTRLTRAGFYRVRFFQDGADQPTDTIEFDNYVEFDNFQNLRSAIILPYNRADHPGMPRTGWEHVMAWKDIWQLFGKAGIGFAKCYFRWDAIEPWEGHADYTACDQLIKNLHENDIDVLVTSPSAVCGWNCEVSYDMSGVYQPSYWRGYCHGQPYHRREGGSDLLRSVQRPGGGWAAEFDTSEKPDKGVWRLQQRDMLKLTEGKTYRISFHARCAGQGKQKARVALLTYPERKPAGMDEIFDPQPEHGRIPVWQEYEFDFVCSRTTLLGSSLQFHLEESGVLAIDNVSLREIVSENSQGPELVVNGDFEQKTISPGRVHSARKIPHQYGREARMAPVPPDMNKVREYFTRMADHFKGRVKYWEVMHESYFPTMDQKLQYLKAVYEGIKASDPESRVLCGAANTFLRLGSWGEMWRHGINEYFDGSSSSGYEGQMPPECLEKLLGDLRVWCDKNGGSKPVYHTEGWRWADDDPTEPPWEVSGTYGPLKSEKAYGDYMVRYGTILFGNGVDFVTYIAGPLESLARPLVIHWLEYGLVPRKIYPVQAGFAHIVTPDAKLYKKLYFFDDNIYAYVFRRTNDAVAVIWAPRQTYRIKRKLLNKVTVLDIFAEPIEERSVPITESAVYLVGDSVKAVVEAVTALRLAQNE